jgi:hypothetical protein
MKTWLLAVAGLVVVASLLAACGGGGEGGGGAGKRGPVGTYVHRDNPKKTLELRTDETYLLKSEFPALPGSGQRPKLIEKTGIWSWGDEAKRSICLEGTLLCLTVRGNTLIDSVGGDVYVKK